MTVGPGTATCQFGAIPTGIDQLRFLRVEAGYQRRLRMAYLWQRHGLGDGLARRDSDDEQR